MGCRWDIRAIDLSRSKITASIVNGGTPVCSRNSLAVLLHVPWIASVVGLVKEARQ